MPLVDLEVTVTAEERAVRETARRFALEVMRPAGAALDRLPDPAMVIDRKSVLWDVFRKYWELNLEVLDAADPSLSPVEHARLRFLLSEELGWGDAGLAISLGVASFHKMFAMMSGRPALMERFGGPDNRDIGCWAVTEPDHGSDSLTVTNVPFADRGSYDVVVSNAFGCLTSTVATVTANLAPADAWAPGADDGVCATAVQADGSILVSKYPRKNTRNL